MEKPQIIVHTEKAVNFSLFDAKWVPCSARFVTLGTTARGTGMIQMYEVVDGVVTLTKEVEKMKGFRCGTFGASRLAHRYLATGDFDGKLHLWNLEDTSSPIFFANAHSEIVNCIDGIGGGSYNCGACEIVTGSRDGSVKVWDVRQKEKPVAIMAPKEGEAHRDCWSVAFGNSYNSEERIVCAGYDNGDIKMFDLKKMALRWETNVKNGVCGLEFDRSDIEMNKLVATTLEAKFMVYDLRTQHPKKGFSCVSEKAHKSTVWLARHLPQNREIFMTCGGGGSLMLWKYQYPEKRFKEDSNGDKEGVVGTIELLNNSTLSSQPISSLDWSPDKTGLAVCTSFDQIVRLLIVTKLNLC